MPHRREPGHAVHRQRRGRDALDLGAHLGEHLAQVDDLRLARDVVDDRRTRRRAPRPSAGSRSRRRSGSPATGSRRAAGRRTSATTKPCSMRTSAPSSVSPVMCMSSPREPMLSPPGSATCARPQRATSGPEHADRGAQPAHQVVGRLVPRLLGHVDGHGAARVRETLAAAPGPRARGCSTSTVQPSSSSSRAITCTSRMSGTLLIMVRPRGEQRGGHQLQRAVLGAADVRRARERVRERPVGPDLETLHRPDASGRRCRSLG